MRIAGRIVYDTHQYIKDYIKPGITTGELDKLAHDYIISRDATPSVLDMKDILLVYVYRLMRK